MTTLSELRERLERELKNPMRHFDERAPINVRDENSYFQGWDDAERALLSALEKESAE